MPLSKLEKESGTTICNIPQLYIHASAKVVRMPQSRKNGEKLEKKPRRANKLRGITTGLLFNQMKGRLPTLIELPVSSLKFIPLNISLLTSVQYVHIPAFASAKRNSPSYCHLLSILPLSDELWIQKLSYYSPSRFNLFACSLTLSLWLQGQKTVIRFKTDSRSNPNSRFLFIFSFTIETRPHNI